MDHGYFSQHEKERVRQTGRDVHVAPSEVVAKENGKRRCVHHQKNFTISSRPDMPTNNTSTSLI